MSNSSFTKVRKHFSSKKHQIEYVSVAYEGWMIKSPPSAMIKQAEHWRRRYFRILQLNEESFVEFKKIAKKTDEFQDGFLQMHYCLVFWSSEIYYEIPIRVIPLFGSKVKILQHGMFSGVIKLDTLNRTYYLRHEDTEEKIRCYNVLSTTIDTQHQHTIEEARTKESQNNNITDNLTATEVVGYTMTDFDTSKHDAIAEGLPSSSSWLNDANIHVENSTTTTIATTSQQSDEKPSTTENQCEESLEKNCDSCDDEEGYKNYQFPSTSGTQQPLMVSSADSVTVPLTPTTEIPPEPAVCHDAEDSLHYDVNNTRRKVCVGEIKIEYSYDGHVEVNRNRISIFTTERLNNKTIRISEPWYDSEKNSMERCLRFGKNVTIRCPLQIQFKLLTPRKLNFFLKNEDVVVVINEIKGATLTRL